MKVAEADSDDEGGADAADELEDDEDDLGDADAEYIESLENGVCVCVLSSYAWLNCSPAFGIMSMTHIQELGTDIIVHVNLHQEFMESCLIAYVVMTAPHVCTHGIE